MTTIADIMTRRTITVEMDDSLSLVRDLFEDKRFHHLLVLDHGRLVGVLSDRDLLRNISPFVGKFSERSQDAACLRRRVHQIMTRRLVCISHDESVEEGARRMLTHGVACLPVVDHAQRCVGIITWHDLLHFAYAQPEQIDGTVEAA